MDGNYLLDFYFFWIIEVANYDLHWSGQIQESKDLLNNTIITGVGMNAHSFINVGDILLLF